MIESVTYGSTVICSSFTKASAAHFSTMARSPRNSPSEDAGGEPDEDSIGERHCAVTSRSQVTVANLHPIGSRFGARVHDS